MKLVINKTKILKALNVVSKVMAGKPITPILFNYKIDLTQDKLSFCGSNSSSMTIVYTIPAKDENDEENFTIGETGSCLLHNRWVEAFRKLEDEKVSLELFDDAMLMIKSGKGEKTKLNIAVPSAAEFPNLITNVKAPSIFVDKKVFCDAVTEVAFAAVQKDTANILTAVNVEIKDGILSLCATDGARLSRKTIEVKTGENCKCNIPVKVITEIVKLAEDVDEIEMKFGEKNACFVLGNTTVYTALLLEPFPNVTAILQIPHTIDLKVNSKELIGALERTNLAFGDGKTPVAQFSISSSAMIITSRQQAGSKVTESIEDYNYSADNTLDINLSITYLLQAIKAVDDEYVVLRFAGSYKPMFVCSENKPTLTQVITPLRISN